MTAPYIPSPLPFQIDNSIADQGKLRTEGVITPSIPDIYPAFGRGLISDMLEGLSRTSTSPDHLAEWMEIVSKDNPAKNVFQSYERRFWVQHYWRVLHQRYCDSLHRTKGKLRIAFAGYFGVDKGTIKNDLNHMQAKRRTRGDHHFAVKRSRNHPGCVGNERHGERIVRA